MLIFTEVLAAAQQQPELELTLGFHQRQKSRARVTLNSGVEAALQLPRGTVLKQGDILSTEQGETVVVFAANEEVSTVYIDDTVKLAQAAYHLGNRHVAVQIGDGWLRYLADHVLDDMLRQMNLHPESERTTFEPESGAYAHGHHHG